MLGEKGKKMLVLNDFKFLNSINKKKNENTWRCVINKCSVQKYRYTVGQNIQSINKDKSCFDRNRTSDNSLKQLANQ